jgi:IS5 family transposase
MSKEKQQMDFVDAMASRENRGNRTARFLQKLESVLDFAPIEAALREAYTATRGRDPHDPLVMFKMTLLQHFYDLSDPECEAQVADRRSFREFCGLGLGDRVPDETALVRFRARLVARGLHTRLLGVVNAQLEARGLMVKTVTLVDATIVESARRKPTRAEVAEGTAGDPGATYTSKGGKAYYGYKAHIAADGEHTLIRAAELTAASMHDSRKFKDVCPADTEVAIADKAYASAEHEAWLEARGIHSGIMQPARTNRPLSEEQQEINGWLAAARAGIEKIFGHWKRVLGWRRMRYTGLLKGTLELQLKSVAWNLKRLVTLCAA